MLSEETTGPQNPEPSRAGKSIQARERRAEDMWLPRDGAGRNPPGSWLPSKRENRAVPWGQGPGGGRRDPVQWSDSGRKVLAALGHDGGRKAVSLSGCS